MGFMVFSRGVGQIYRVLASELNFKALVDVSSGKKIFLLSLLDLITVDISGMGKPVNLLVSTYQKVV
jgi:hypothetical protein